MDQFFKVYKVSKPTQKEIDNLIILLNKMSSQLKFSEKKESPDSDNFSGKFYQMFKEEIKLILYNFSRK